MRSDQRGERATGHAVLILLALAGLPTVIMVLSTVYLIGREVWRAL